VKVIALHNIKGGVGKTASAVNLAWLAARGGARTLLFDLDPQGAASFYLRVRPRRHARGKELLRHDLADSIRGSDFPGLDVLPADLSHRKLERAFEHEKHKQLVLSSALKPLQSDYDFVFLDCPPGIGRLAQNVFHAADALLVPTIPTTLSLRTLAQLMRYLSRRNGKALRVLPFFCIVDRRKLLHREVCAWVHAHDLGFLSSEIPSSSDVERMGTARNPLFAFASTCPAARAYISLWEEVCARLAEGAVRSPLLGKQRRKGLERLAEHSRPSQMPEIPWPEAP
jgi:cellulose biosynthesis protein BcsQ